MTDHDDDDRAGLNGAGGGPPELPQDPAEAELLSREAPPEVRDLAEACVRFVERAVGVRLDYTLETLPLLDHYLSGAREAAGSKPDAKAPTLAVVAQAAGAYFGEVARRRHASWWRVAGDPERHRLEFYRVHLVVRPISLVLEALTLDPQRKGAGDDLSGFELDDEDRAVAGARLRELPDVPLEEFVAPSTRLEVLDIVIDALRAHHVADGAPPLELEPDDYGESD